MSILLLPRSRRNHLLSSDPLFGDVVSLCHFNGTNGSTTITDQIAGRTWAANGDAALSTTQKQFGVSSAKAAAGYVQLSADIATTIGTGDFTLEFWSFWSATAGGSIIICDLRDASHPNEIAIYLNGGNLRMFASGADRINGTTFGSASFHSIALCRSSGSSRLFLDGAQVGSTYADSNNYANTIATLLAQYNGSGQFDGYVDEFRFTKAARYISNYTPAGPFPDS